MKSNKIILKVDSLTKDYLDPTGFKLRLFEDLSFNIHENEFTVFLAPKGAGKSTLFRILAKVEGDYSGNVISERNRLSVLIADKPTTLQWLSVKDNIKFAAKNKNEEDIKKVIADVGLEGYEDFSPHPQSYGFRFRVELARALIHNPEIILIDDALKNISDAEVRYELLLKLRELNKKYSETTFLFATNNLTDGLFLSDKFIVMSNHPGKIIDTLEINLPDERDFEIVKSQQFSDFRNKIEKIYKEHNNQLFLEITV